MKKRTITLITAPILLAGAAAFAGMQHYGNYENCHRGQGSGYEDRMNKSDKKDRAERQVERMSQRLGLSDAQQAELQQLFKAKQEQRQEMRSQMRSLHQATRNLDPKAADYEQRLAQAKQTATTLAVSKIDQKVSMRAALANILTAEQLKNMDEMQQRYKNNDGEGYSKHHKEGQGMRRQLQE